MSNEYQPFEVDLNLEQVETWDGQQRPLLPVDAGYHFKVVGVDNDGKQITIQSEVIEGGAGETDSQVGSYCWNNYNIQHKVGLKRLKCFMVAIGASLGKFNSDEVMGQAYYADIVHNQGKAQVDPTTGQTMEPRMFANVINERGGLGDEGGTTEPEKPPITRSAAPATPAAPTAPAGNGNATANSGNKRQGGARRA